MTAAMTTSATTTAASIVGDNNKMNYTTASDNNHDGADVSTVTTSASAPATMTCTCANTSVAGRNKPPLPPPTAEAAITLPAATTVEVMEKIQQQIRDRKCLLLMNVFITFLFVGAALGLGHTQLLVSGNVEGSFYTP